MSWEEVGWSEVPCPCGRGAVVTVREMDEQNRGRKRSVLVCDFCEQETKLRWDEDGRRSGEKRKEILDLKDRIRTIFDLRYLRYWQGHFSLCRSKRAVYEILQEGGVIDLGLSTFYKELRDLPLPYYLRQIATVSNMKMILSILEVQDEELEHLLEEVLTAAGEEYIDLLQNR